MIKKNVDSEVAQQFHMAAQLIQKIKKVQPENIFISLFKFIPKYFTAFDPCI